MPQRALHQCFHDGTCAFFCILNVECPRPANGFFAGQALASKRTQHSWLQIHATFSTVSCLLQACLMLLFTAAHTTPLCSAGTKHFGVSLEHRGNSEEPFLHLEKVLPFIAYPRLVTPGSTLELPLPAELNLQREVILRNFDNAPVSAL